MTDRRTREELQPLMNEIQDDVNAYRHIRQRLEQEELMEKEENIYRDLKEEGDRVVIHEIMPMQRNYFAHLFNTPAL